MKDGRFEKSDLDAADHIRVLVALLVAKEVITSDEYTKFCDEVLEHKNKQLEQEIKDNPGMEFLLTMMSNLNKDE